MIIFVRAKDCAGFCTCGIELSQLLAGFSSGKISHFVRDDKGCSENKDACVISTKGRNLSLTLLKKGVDSFEMTGIVIPSGCEESFRAIFIFCGRL